MSAYSFNYLLLSIDGEETSSPLIYVFPAFFSIRQDPFNNSLFCQKSINTIMGGSVYYNNNNKKF